MAYDEYLADRIRQVLDRRNTPPVEEKKMMGGLSFMVDNKMCVGIIKTDLMARIDPDIYDDALAKRACRPMDFTKRPMKGFVYIGPEGVEREKDLEYWIDLALEFNPKAKSSKKKK